MLFRLRFATSAALTLALLSTAVQLDSLAIAGEPVEVIRLWDGDAPHSGGNQPLDVPVLHLFRVESDKPSTGVVVVPGGGYGGLAMSHEGTQIAEWFRDMGVTAAICQYRHRGGGSNAGKGYGHPVPLLDAQRAIRVMRANAAKWNIDPEKVGVIGFSAGGHLASTVSTHHDPGDADSEDVVGRQSSRPQFSILCYPVISLSESFTHAGSRRNLLGENPPDELLAELSNEKRVAQDTPPTFLFHTLEDQVVLVENSLAYYAALRAAGVAAEMHLFEKGPHGVGLAKDIPGTSRWPELCKAWLKLHEFVE